MIEKDKNFVSKIAKECARDYGLIKNSGVDTSSIPPRQWIRAWMQTHYNIIKLSGYFYREFEKSLNPKSNLSESSLGLNKKVQSKFKDQDAISSVQGINLETFREELVKRMKTTKFSVIFEDYEDKGKTYIGFKNPNGIKFFKVSEVLVILDPDEMTVKPRAYVLDQKVGDYWRCLKNSQYQGVVLPMTYESIDIFVAWIEESCPDPETERFEKFISKVEDKSLFESNLGLSKRVQKNYSKKSADDVIEDLSTYSDIDDVINKLASMVKNFYDIFDCDKVDNSQKSGNEYWKLTYINPASKKIAKNLFIYYEYYYITKDNPTNYIGFFSYDERFQKYMEENHPDTIIDQRTGDTATNVFGNPDPTRVDKMPLSVIEIVADWINREIVEKMNESSLGLNKKIQKQYKEKDTIDSLENNIPRNVYSKILNILRENGFKKDIEPIFIESSNVFMPSRYLTYTCTEYEETIFSKVTGKDEKYDCYIVNLFIEKTPLERYVYDEEENLVLQIKINPNLEFLSKRTANQASMSTSRYDKYGWCGIGSEIRMAAFKEPASTSIGQNFTIPLKNSYPVEYEFFSDMASNTEIDLNDGHEIAFIADVEGIIKTIAGFQQDCIKSKDIPYKRINDFSRFDQDCMKFLSGYFFKNTENVRNTINEANLGLNKRVQNSFKGKTQDDQAIVDAVTPNYYVCLNDKDQEVKVYKSETNEWKNRIFEWMKDNIPTMRIKDDEKRAEIGRETIKVEDFISTFNEGVPQICMYHHEFSSYFEPMYVNRLADYFNGVLTDPYPLTLTAWNIGNYAHARVHLFKVGKKWRMTVEAYYQDKAYATKRCPNGQWRRAKKTVLSKDVPILEKLDDYLKKK